MVDLPSAEHVAFVAVSVLAAIVTWDAYWLTKQRRDVPELGQLPGGGFAWSSEGVHEMIRQWGNLGSMAAMMRSKASSASPSASQSAVCLA